MSICVSDVNVPIEAVFDRTAYLKNRLDASDSSLQPWASYPLPPGATCSELGLHVLPFDITNRAAYGGAGPTLGRGVWRETALVGTGASGWLIGFPVPGFFEVAFQADVRLESNPTDGATAGVQIELNDPTLSSPTVVAVAAAQRGGVSGTGNPGQTVDLSVSAIVHVTDVAATAQQLCVRVAPLGGGEHSFPQGGTLTITRLPST